MNDNAPPTELQSLLAEPPRVTWRRRFLEGAACPWRGLRYLNRRPALWRYAVLPLIANLLITAVVLAFLILAVGWFLAVVHPWFQSADSDWSGWVWLIAEIVLAGLLVIVCVGAALLLWKLLNGVLCGYFYGVLAKHVEEDLGVAPGELRDLSLKYQVIDTCRDLAALVTVHAAFFVVGLVPLVGAPLAMAGDFSLTWFIFGSDYLDFPLALRGMRRQEKRRICREHLPQTLGLGAVVFVMEFIPVVGAVFLTTAVVGAVLLHRRLSAKRQAMT